MHVSQPGARLLGAALSVLLAVGLSAAVGVVGAPPADAAVARPFTLNYNDQVYGDFIEAGDGNSVCPGLTAPTDPFGEPKATCGLAQARSYTAAAGINDSYYMQWSDVDSNAATFNSSDDTITVPPGARVDLARLSWSGDTGTIRLADGTVSALPGCNTRQFLAGGGTAVLPAGTPESTSVRLAVGAGAATAVAPQSISRDSLASVPASQPQFYTAHADVTAQLQAAATGAATTITVGNVWTPQGFGCYSGWSLVVVYAYDEPDPTYAPGKREIFLYDGHVRQSSVDPTTTINVTGFRVAATPVRVGVTSYEGDFNIAGDQFSINGVPMAEPVGGSTTNFWVSDAEDTQAPLVPNNMSVDAKDFDTPTIPVGATSATLSFSTAGDTYLAQNLVFSVPVSSVSITKTVVGGPFRPGQSIPFVIEVVSPGGVQAVNVLVDDPLYADCDRDLGTMLADVPVTYTCTGPAPGADGVNTAIITAEDPFGDQITDSDDAAFDIINPAIDITKLADKLSYAAGELITFNLTVTNTGDAPLTSVAVADPKVPACDSVTPLLAPGGSFSYTCTTVAPLAGDENTATVTGLDPLFGIVTDTASAPAPTVSTVSGQVFADRNDNAVSDVADGDTGISGVSMALTGTTVDGVPVSLLTQTAADGTYSFADVPAGTYRVAEGQPPAFDDGQDTPGDFAVADGNDAFAVTLGPGDGSDGNDFAELPTSSLAGAVFEDSDGNGVRDGGEPPIVGVTVTLTGLDGAGNPVTLTSATAGDGTYTFPRLRDGQYTLTETQPAGYRDATDTVGSAGGVLLPPDGITAIPLLPRTGATGYFFGETLAASIAGRVVDDAGNGIAGATVTLTGPVPDPVVMPTDLNGDYSFTDLVPGTYTVTETQPVGYGDGPDTLGSVGGDDSVSDSFSGIVIRSGVNATGYLFAEARGSLAGTVYEDLNGNGLHDSGELGMPGATLSLNGTDALGSPVTRTATSQGNGSYLFDDLLGGMYTVTETQPLGYLDGVDQPGTSGGTVLPPDTITAIALAPGVNATGYLFAETVTASISGRVVDDGGNGIPGVAVTLTGGASPATVFTAADGTYSFTGLLPGTYAVAAAQPTGYGDGPETVGSAGGTNSANDVISGIVIGSGNLATGYVFAENRGSLAGAVYQDLDGNGTREPGEPGIGGVTVTLTAPDSTDAPLNLVTTTAGDGSYLFDDLLTGTYVVTETQPGGYLDGADTAGTAGGTVTPGDSIIAIQLGPGMNAIDYRFGELAGASIAGSVTDDGGNAISTAVALTGTDDRGSPVSLTTTSAGPGGTYLFDWLRPGTYTVTETQPDGYGDGADAVGSAGGVNSADDVVSQIQLAAGVAATGYDFAETRGSLAGAVYVDANGDGMRQAGEAGIDQVVVTLTGTDLRGGPVSRTATTVVDGSYTFEDLLGGTYDLAETQPAGYLDGGDTVGSSGGTRFSPDFVNGITLVSGTDATGYLFGESVTSSISGRVVDDTGYGIAGVTVNLTGPISTLAVDVTDADGGYSFLGLVPGTYILTEVQPLGYGDGPDTAGSAGGDDSVSDVISAIVIASGTVATDYVFAETRGSIAGSVYSDLDNDGTRDPAEVGIPGVGVLLTGTDATGAPIGMVATTADDGSYLFNTLLAGSYALTEFQPAGYFDGIDAVGSSGGTLQEPNSIIAITLAPGVDATGYLFGELVHSSIAGTVTDDDGNPINGVTVSLGGTDDLGNPVSIAAVTAAGGAYAFGDLRPGTYTVAETQPVGYGDGPDTVGSAGGDNSVNDVISAIVLGPGTAATGYVFAEARGSLAGSVYVDQDNCGEREPGEAGIPGVTVELTGTDAAGAPVVLTAVTDGTGSFLFDDLLAGTYQLVANQPAGYLDGLDRVGSAGGTQLSPDAFGEISLPPGVDATGYLFGELLPSSVAGSVTDDGGNPIAGVAVTLTGTNDTGEPVSLPTTTGAGGTYGFAGVRPGTYAVAETQPVGYGDGADTVGSAGGSNSANDVVSEIVLVAGTVAAGYDFAETRGSLAGAVYVDANGDGTRQDGEAGIDGVTVTLTGTDDRAAPVSRLVTTSGGGAFAFDDLLGGTYAVVETQPDGYLDGGDTVGSSGGTLAPPDSTIAITLTPGTDAIGYLFGESVAASLTGRVVDDATNGIPGVTVTLTGPIPDPVTLVTDTDGRYTFTDLLPGSYTVTETQPLGYGDGPDTVGTAGGDSSVDDTISAIQLASGTVATGYDFAETRGSLAGAVYDDTNGDGTRQDGEAGIGGVTVTLTGTDALGEPVMVTETTVDDGSYLFDDLLAGTYDVVETQADGYLDGPETVGTAGGVATPPDSVVGVELNGGTDAVGYLFAEFTEVSVTGRIVDDFGNPIPGVALTLTGPDTTSAVALFAATVSGPDGTWTFDGLSPGTYTLSETQPLGYGDGPDTVGSAGGVNSANDVISGIVLGAGIVAEGYAFAEITGSLAGVVYVDADGDGAQQVGEAGVDGVNLTLTGIDALDRPVTLTTSTDGDGAYVFTELVGGTYTLTEEQPSAYADGADSVGTAGGTAAAPDGITGIALAAGQAATGYLFGELPGAIGGLVYLDTDGDGNRDLGETTVLADVVVMLLDADGIEITSTTTDADGAYLFVDLPAGEYTVEQEQPAGYGSSTPNRVDVTMEADLGATVDFGERLGSISGFVWSDVNGNGVQDDVEPGVANAVVVLLDAAGDEVARATTEAGGTYSFTMLRPARYSLTIAPPAGSVLVRPNVGGNDAVDSDFDWLTLASGPLVVEVVDDVISQLDTVDAGLVVAVTDLAITLTADRLTAYLGDTVVFTAVVRNDGTVAVPGATARISVPSGLRIGTASGSGWTCTVTGQVATCTTTAMILPGEAAPPILVSTTAVSAMSSTSATAQVFAPPGVIETDPSNNSAVVAVRVVAVVQPSPPPPLVRTGVQAIGLVFSGLLLLAAGCAALLYGRRRRNP